MWYLSISGTVRCACGKRVSYRESANICTDITSAGHRESGWHYWYKINFDVPTKHPLPVAIDQSPCQCSWPNDPSPPYCGIWRQYSFPARPSSRPVLISAWSLLLLRRLSFPRGLGRMISSARARWQSKSWYPHRSTSSHLPGTRGARRGSRGCYCQTCGSGRADHLR